MERLISPLEPIQRAGVVFHERVRKAGVYHSDQVNMDKVERVFRELYQIKPFRDIIDKTNLNLEDGEYLIFAPTVKPEHSLSWMAVEEGRVDYKDFLHGWNFKTFYAAHFRIYMPGSVEMCFDEKNGDLWLKTNSRHMAKPHV